MRTSVLLAGLAVMLPLFPPAHAGPWIAPGEPGLRHDIQLLADAGIIDGPVSSWPLAWGDLRVDLQHPASDLGPGERAALARLRARLREATELGALKADARVALTQSPPDIRTSEELPRETAELGASVEWTSRHLAVRLEGQRAHDPNDGKEWRPDGSYIGTILGNWSLTAGFRDQYWGPGWQSSLLFSNNARPIPTISIDRNRTDGFRTPWLSWLGSWDLSVNFGFLEDDRAVPDAQLFATRFTFRPLQRLEIGLSGMGLWCGSGRDCGASEFVDLLFGGGSPETDDPDRPPGDFDRLIGMDLRWSSSLLDRPFAFYTHIIGEDFGDGASRKVIPTALLGQFGLETWGHWEALGSYRLYLEWVDTECDGNLFEAIDPRNAESRPGCAFRNNLFESGQTFRGRSFAHSADQDSSVATLGLVLNDPRGGTWHASFAHGTLNRRGANRSTVAFNETDYRELELTHRRRTRWGRFHLGVGVERFEDTVVGDEDHDVRVFAEWSVPVRR